MKRNRDQNDAFQKHFTTGFIKRFSKIMLFANDARFPFTIFKFASCVMCIETESSFLRALYTSLPALWPDSYA